MKFSVLKFSQNSVLNKQVFWNTCRLVVLVKFKKKQPNRRLIPLNGNIIGTWDTQFSEFFLSIQSASFSAQPGWNYVIQGRPAYK